MKILFRVAASGLLAVALVSGVGVVRADAHGTEFEHYTESPELTSAHADVFRLYWAFFDREPDLDGATYWVDRYDRCASLPDITWSFSNSDEFMARYGSLTDEQYVDLVYNNVLGRQPDEEGRRYWLGQLTAKELIQAEVMLYFSLGLEFKRTHPLPSDGRPNADCTPDTSSTDTGDHTSTPYYANCTEAREAGAAPILRGEPGYRSELDRDDDGIACET